MAIQSILTEQQIIAEISTHMRKEGSHPSKWYVGIAANVEMRLFEAHNVPRENAWRIHRDASSSEIARRIESYFVHTVGTDGGTGGGDWQTRWVYAYLKTTQTNP